MLVIVLVAFTAGVWKLWKYYWYFVVGSPLRNLPGPPVSSFIYGNEKELFKSDNHTLPEKWFSQYGKHFVDNGFLMAQRLWTLDPRALNHILTHYDDYGRLEENTNTFTDVLGKGVLFVTGDAHRKQRRIMNSAFGPAQVRNLTGIFLQKASELAKIWSSVTRDGSARVDANSDLGKMALDVIGLAGFGYDFHALNADGQPNELNLAFRSIMGNTACMTSFAFYLGGRFPILKLVPNKGVKHMLDAAKVIHRVARELVETRKAAVLKEMEEKSIDGLKRQDLEGQDLLTLLIKANMAEDVPDSQKLSDEDVMGQIPTFLFAGHETVSTAITWTFFALSRNTEAQKKLREELSAVETDRPTADELSALPYLDMVVRETLRLHSPVAMLFREAKKNDVIPLSEPFIDRYGRVRQEIEIAKGNKVALPIFALHRSKAIWGEDAMEFRPERWQQPPEAIAKVPGVWGHLLAFIGGPRACIGYRFALLEIKAALFTLVRGFEFELAVPQERVVVKTGPLQRPVLCGEEGAQLPIIIKAI